LVIAAVAIVVVAVAAWFLLRPGIPNIPPIRAVKIVKTFPHDPTAFTEGLFFQDGLLYEGTGGEPADGTSGFRKSKLETGEIVAQVPLADHFGEGIIAWKDRLIQLTWQDHVAFVHGLADFKPRSSFAYPYEGWGMTHNGKNLIASDGTATLHVLDPDTYKQVSTIAVTANGCPVEKLNELEWIDGDIYANIWQTHLIARIDPASGKVKEFLDVSALDPHIPDPDAVANGIAWDAAGKRLLVTGKRWPSLYEVTASDTVELTQEAATIVTCATSISK
jgi:glutaminyl-peptide cyclotransferase